MNLQYTAVAMAETDYDVRLDDLYDRSVSRLAAAQVFDVAAFEELLKYLTAKASRIVDEHVVSKQVLRCIVDARDRISRDSEHLPEMREHRSMAERFDSIFWMLAHAQHPNDISSTTMIDAEIARLEALYEANGLEFSAAAGASEADIAELSRTTGVEITGDLVELYRRHNGSDIETFFAVNPPDPSPCLFHSISQVISRWTSLAEHHGDEEQRAEESARRVQGTARDARIQQDVWWCEGWIPIGSFNDVSTIIYWDAAPAPTGKVGQIIVFHHFPDGVYYGAPDFLTFFRESNDLIEAKPRELLFGE